MISAIKIIFILGFLISIHELGHFTIAKLCKIKVNEFSIGFGPVIWSKQGKETVYKIRAIPLGGFVNMLGEEERSEEEGSFSRAKIWKRIAIVSAGGLVNILFAVIVFFILALVTMHGGTQHLIKDALISTGEFVFSVFEGLKLLFTGNVGIDQFVGPVGISEMIATTNGIKEFFYLFAVISISIGVTNLLPFPPLDGGKILLLIIEKIKGKPLNQKFELNVQLAGFLFLILLSIVVTYNDIIRIIM